MDCFEHQLKGENEWQRIVLVFFFFFFLQTLAHSNAQNNRINVALATTISMMYYGKNHHHATRLNKIQRGSRLVAYTSTSFGKKKKKTMQGSEGAQTLGILALVGTCCHRHHHYILLFIREFRCFDTASRNKSFCKSQNRKNLNTFEYSQQQIAIRICV